MNADPALQNAGIYEVNLEQRIQEAVIGNSK